MKDKKKGKGLCPCGEGRAYAECCGVFHRGALPKSALRLMRSRYAAYALAIPEYIIHTTHPAHPDYDNDQERWIKEISEFCLNTHFHKLEILDHNEEEKFATVTFIARLTQGKRDLSFTEKSRFEKWKGKWLYHSGQLSEDYL